MKLLFIAISALRTFAMGFSHYSSTVGINKHLTKFASFVFLVWKKISSCASLETSVFHGLACSHAVFKTHGPTLSFFLPFTNIFPFPLSFPDHQLYSVEKKRLGGENRGIRIYIFIKQSLHSSKKGITQVVLVMFNLPIIFRGMPSYL